MATTPMRSGNECNFPGSVAAVLHLIDLLLVDIEGHETAISHHRDLILMTLAPINSGIPPRGKILGMRADSINKFQHIICTILTNREVVEVILVITPKNHPTTVTLDDGQLHLEREVAQYRMSRTPSEKTVRLLAHVIGSMSKPTRTSVVAR
jgi:hypothetical protein